MTQFKIIASINEQDAKKRLKEPHPTLSVVGPLHIKIGEKTLPNLDWDDFVFIVITWWLKDLAILLKEGKVICDFMDDDYKMELILVPNSNMLQLNFFHEGLDKYYVKNENVPLDAYVKELFNVALKLEKQVAKVDPNVAIYCNDFKDFQENMKKAEKAWHEYTMQIT